jgi:glycosyltransferase involved in cell wall biosynthesis
MLKIAIVANTPAPYRVPIYERVAATNGIELQVIYCCEREPNRTWDLPTFNFNHTFLRQRFITWSDRYIHNNFDVVSVLTNFSPNVIITDGFNPTYIYAFGYALWNSIPHIPMTDGTYNSELHFSFLHKAIRSFVYKRSKSFISASLGGKKLYESYGIDGGHCFQSCLCIDNSRFSPDDYSYDKAFDFIFCGRIEEPKNPQFALDVARNVARRIGRKVSILFVGYGSQEDKIKSESKLSNNLVNVEFTGGVSQNQLPKLYQSARILLFPTIADVWGVVANEACAAGLPVIVSPYAGVANELIIDSLNGFVCHLDVNLWEEKAVQLLTSPVKYSNFSKKSYELVSKYNFEAAARGIIDACNHAVFGQNEITKKMNKKSLSNI